VGVDPFQAEVARIALEVAREHGYALAGGNALAAHDLTDRPTEDVDLFTPEPGGPGAVAEGVRSALEAAGYLVQVIRPAEQNRGEFVRLSVTLGKDTMLLDLARDWRQWPPVDLDIGPVLHLDDAVGSKVTAMVFRRLPRDFMDVAAVIAVYSRADLMRLAFTRDPGLRVVDFTDAALALDEVPAAAFAPYGLPDDAVEHIRERFADWPRYAAADDEGHAIYQAVRKEESIEEDQAGPAGP